MASGRPTVVAVMAGSAVVMPWLESVDAALMLWYAGMEGGHALADVLLGVREPGGRLPFAVPHREEDLVAFDREATRARYGLLHGQWHLDAEGVEAHLPFGFGLGYGRCELQGAELIEADTDKAVVEAELGNAGQRAGSTVVFVFGSVPGSDHVRPERRLLGFRRVALEPGGVARVPVTVDLGPLDLRLEGGWTIEDREVVLSVGLDANAKGLLTVRGFRRSGGHRAE